MLEKFTTQQMLDVHLPTTDGRESIMSRYTHSGNSFSDLEQYASELRLVVQHVEHIVATGELAQFIGCRESSS